MNVIAVFQSIPGLEAIAPFIPMLVIFGIFYFLLIAPASKQRRKTQAMIEALKKGDRVLTTGGIYGTVVAVEGDAVQVKIADNVKIRMTRSAVASLVADSPE